MDRPKLLALDMDGTLLDSRKRLSPRTLNALRALSAGGVCVAAATGRGWAEMEMYLALMPFMRWGILTSGAMIVDFHSSQPLRITAMRTEDVNACLDVCRREDAMPHFLTVRESVVREDQIGRLAEFHHGDYVSLFGKVCVRVSDMRAYAASHTGDVLKVCMYHRDVRGRLRSLNALKDTGLDLRFSGSTSLEAVAGGISKGEGLKALAARLGLETSECAAVGDADNDLDLLRTAGLSAAMGNAPEHVRREADMTVADNDHDGVAEAVGRMFGIWAE